MANITTYNIRTHAKNSAASDIKKTDAFIITFAYIIAINKKTRLLRLRS